MSTTTISRIQKGDTIRRADRAHWVTVTDVQPVADLGYMVYGFTQGKSRQTKMYIAQGATVQVKSVAS